MDKTKIMGYIADMSMLLGMIPDDGKVSIKNPLKLEAVEKSGWFAETRDPFLQLSRFVGRALDVSFQ